MSDAKHISNVIGLSRVVVGSYKGLVAVRGVRQVVTDDEEFEWYAEKYKEGCRTQLDFLEAAFSHD